MLISTKITSLNSWQCYDILGLQKDASFKEVKQAYRKLSLMYHPDRNKEADSEKKFKEITEAYQILKVEQKKENVTHKDAGKAHADFWNYHEKTVKEEFNVGYQAYFNQFKQDFGAAENDYSHNMERPVSHKSTHILLYGGLGALALWIIISEIFKH